MSVPCRPCHARVRTCRNACIHSDIVDLSTCMQPEPGSIGETACPLRPPAGDMHVRTVSCLIGYILLQLGRSIGHCAARGPGGWWWWRRRAMATVGCMDPTAWCFCVRRNVQCVGRRTNEPSIHPSAGSASVHHHYELLPPFHNVIFSSITHIYI